jgi:hypothetical protein
VNPKAPIIPGADEVIVATVTVPEAAAVAPPAAAPLATAALAILLTMLIDIPLEIEMSYLTKPRTVQSNILFTPYVAIPTTVPVAIVGKAVTETAPKRPATPMFHSIAAIPPPAKLLPARNPATSTNFLFLSLFTLLS